ncbi:MAG: hypothetical protein FWG55_04805 [Candidatus Bathyarchaeota archaeon]|nr:hypothetical protein [Candidatus Termiticorpusculum sp.]
MNALTRKISALEKNVVNDTPDPAETYIGSTNKEEWELIKIAKEIVGRQKQQLTELEKSQKVNPTVDYTSKVNDILTLSDEAEAIVMQAGHIALQRAFHIFDDTIAFRYHQGNDLNKTIFYARFFWFLSEMQDMLHHSTMENKIMGESGFFDLCKGEQDKKLKVCYDSWREWFSSESFVQWLKSNPFTPSNTKLIQEEVTETEEYNAIKETEQKANERDAKHLKEKCPTCSNKCKLYNKQKNTEQ